MSWSPQQDAALKAVRQWLADRSGPQVFRLFGFAGTGKTTLARELAACVTGHVLYATFTGKAALVLRKKGCDDASTIHSLIYKPIEDELTGHTEFKLNPDSALSMAGLLIVDEVSMVGEDLAVDLLSFGTRILVLGDPEQLPPVKGEGYFINAKADVMLTEVHRQAADNPIIRMSMDIREGRGLQLGTYGQSQVLARSAISKEALREMVLESDQLICGMNKTRQAFNERIRELKGLAGRLDTRHPVAGERLICLRNNKTKGLFNGGMWEVSSSHERHGRLEMLLASLDEPGSVPVDVVVPEEFFFGTEQGLDWRERRKNDEFTFGWAITCHKSQGSQYDYPLVFDESSVFREDARKWLYTAVTRAADRITVIV
ncbi:ATP-binding protein [Kaistia sp. 32K]|uniref:ATP-dependent DNA helicase n=1 Tax=Kaistia sp. 32K TaxID=2795690 RepID=UPI001916871F|nr:AAA family ATPase [Kaistia sp. 32K]BCP56211.1 ATP-binding protein [Kaistia sp. 32K]